MDKKQIEEIAKIVTMCIINNNYRKITENEVVISKEEYINLKKELKDMEEQRDEQAYITEDLIQEKHRWTYQARKEMVEEILKLAEEYNKGFMSDFDNFIEALKEKYGVEIGEEKC